MEHLLRLKSVDLSAGILSEESVDTPKRIADD